MRLLPVLVTVVLAAASPAHAEGAPDPADLVTRVDVTALRDHIVYELGP